MWQGNGVELRFVPVAAGAEALEVLGLRADAVFVNRKVLLVGADKDLQHVMVVASERRSARHFP